MMKGGHRRIQEINTKMVLYVFQCLRIINKTKLLKKMSFTFCCEHFFIVMLSSFDDKKMKKVFVVYVKVA